MRTNLRILASVLLLAALVFWALAGANLGWTKTSVPRKKVDPVTGIEGISYEKRLDPGIDLLAVTALTAGALAGLSFLFPTRTNRHADSHL